MCRLFRRAHTELPPLPTLTEAASVMSDRGLDFSPDEVIDVLYSGDRTKRFVILKASYGCFKYVYEELRLFDRDELAYFSDQPDAVPGYWALSGCFGGASFYADSESVLNEIRRTPEYRAYFSTAD